MKALRSWSLRRVLLVALGWAVGLPVAVAAAWLLRANAQMRALRDSGALAHNSEILVTTGPGTVPDWVTAVSLPVVVFGPPVLLLLGWAWSRQRSGTG